MYKAKCPKCGQNSLVSSSKIYSSCNKCGTSFNAESGECSHGNKKGQCSDTKCDFKK